MDVEREVFVIEADGAGGAISGSAAAGLYVAPAVAVDVWPGGDVGDFFRRSSRSVFDQGRRIRLKVLFSAVRRSGPVAMLVRRAGRAVRPSARRSVRRAASRSAGGGEPGEPPPALAGFFYACLRRQA